MRRLLLLSLLLVAAALAWWPTLNPYFISDSFALPVLLDGQGQVCWDRVLADWYSPWLGTPGTDSWRPLITLHYAIDLFLFGVNPWALHLSNLLCHLAAGLVVFTIFRKLFPRAGLWAAWVGAFVYLVHPARAEAVTWIPGRVDVTAALPTVLAGLAFLHALTHSGRRRLLWLWLSLVFAFLAYAAKEMAMALPATLVFLLAFSPTRKGGSVFLLVPHLLLLAVILLWRIHVLGGVAGDAGSLHLVAGWWATLDDKLLAAFVPSLSTGAGWWLAGLCWLVLPIGAGLLRGRRALGAIVCLGWWGLLVVPASLISVDSQMVGARVLLLPALAGSAFLVILLGRPLASREFWPLGSLRWLAGGLICAMATIGLQGRLDHWCLAGRLASSTIREVTTGDGAGAKGPLGMGLLPVEGWLDVRPFRYDIAFLAFRRPFAARDREVLILENLMLPPMLDSGPLHQAATICPSILAYVPGGQGLAGSFNELNPGPRQDLPIKLDEVTGPGCGLPGIINTAPATWTWLRLPDLDQSILGLEGFAARLAREDPALEIYLSWVAPYPGAAAKAFHGDPHRPGFPGYLAPLYRYGGPKSNAWIASCGNRLDFFAYGRLPDINLHVALVIRGNVSLSALSWLGRLPRSPWRPAGELSIDPGQPRFPCPPEFSGPCRLVVLTPSQVLESFFTARAGETVALPEQMVNILGFVAKVAPRSRIYFYLERLAHPGSRKSTLARTNLFPAYLAGAGLAGLPKKAEK